MKTILLGIIIILGAFITKAQEFQKVWESSKEVLKTPESVLYDEGNDIIYVANINGAPTEKDGNGFISILNSDGSVKTLKWVEGLDAPKGMAISKGKLYVSDIDKLVEIDIEKGKVSDTYNAPDAVFLNDVAASNDGKIFVSDTRTARIYVLNDGNISVWLEGDPLNSPNGLLTENGQLYVGDMNIYKVDISSKKVTTVVEDAGGVDGLDKDNQGNFVYSNWPGMVWIHKNGKNIKLHDSTQQEINTADLDFASKLNLVLVPTFYDNRIVAYKIK